MMNKIQLIEKLQYFVEVQLSNMAKTNPVISFFRPIASRALKKKLSGIMSKAKEVAERYRGIIPQSATYADVYVALNAQYHDYCELLKTWFGDNIDTKVVESAINFWFKDDDYKNGGSKVYKYFREA